MAGKSTGFVSRRLRGTATALALGAGVIAMSGAASASAAAAERPGVAGHSQQLVAAASRATAAGVPGVIVRVDDGHGPEVNIVRQASWSIPDHALTANDEFRMGSNTKTMTATLVLQLVADHRLALDDPIEKRLPGAVPNGRNITVRMLLNHTSGLADYAYDPEALMLMTGRQTEPPTAEQLLAMGTSLPVKFPPGQGWSYSNTNYDALGLLLEKITGQSVADLIQHRIAGPLGLRHTYLATGAPDPADRRFAHGYEPDAAHLAPILPPGTPAGFGFVGPARGERVDVTGIDQSWVGAAGSIVSTTSDWARFDKALLSGRLFPKPLLAQMRVTTQEDEANGLNRLYGLGLEEVHTPCGTVWGHDGALPGYRSDNYTDELGRRTVSVLATTHFGLKTDAAAGTAEDDLVTAAICTMFGKPVPASS
ncbi:beta-lactamase family protein [Actinoallomurus spadix]|uniref:Serine hydrolase domain-containing protein n=1 Tax=Actinoallomurus spadix TaxID=79912 RepID=A0ABN0WXI7_9ACTN|nr:serine hydrolase domain-containing protein [Actinoallomurus spadix]MCO5986661.1 beta-lactamase family protein [Actinoallomurus spadix]